MLQAVSIGPKMISYLEEAGFEKLAARVAGNNP